MTNTAFILESKNLINLSDYKKDIVKNIFENKTIICPDCLESLWFFKYKEHKSFYEILKDEKLNLNKLTKDFQLLYKNESKEFLRNGKSIINHAHFSHFPKTAKICEEKEAPSTLHRELCDLIKNQLYKVFNFYETPKYYICLKEITYIKKPPSKGTKRIPDLSILTFSNEIEKTLYEQNNYKEIKFDNCFANFAIEIQLSNISKNEIKERTEDHLKLYKNVVWIFHQHHLSKVADARDYLDSINIKYFVIKQDKDKKRDIEIVLCEKRKKIKSRKIISYKRCDFPVIVNLVANHLQRTSDDDIKTIKKQLKIKDSYIYSVAVDFFNLNNIFSFLK